MTAPSNPWTPEQLALLEQMRADNVDWPEISERCGHPIGSCRTTLTMFKQHQARIAASELPADTPYGKGAPRNPKRFWTESEVQTLVRMVTVEGKTFADADLEFGRSKGASAAKFEGLRRPTALDTREFRALHEPKHQPQHDSLTAAFFGDPLPGRSALDQRRVEASGITLATGPMR